MVCAECDGDVRSLFVTNFVQLQYDELITGVRRHCWHEYGHHSPGGAVVAAAVLMMTLAAYVSDC